MNFKVLVIILTVLGSITVATAQQADRIQRGQRGYSPPPLERVAGSKTIINTLADIDEKMDLYEAELPLDAFEKAVLKNMIVDFENKRMALHADESIDYKDREEKILKLQDDFRVELATIFPQPKVDVFYGLHFMDEKMLKKKKKRKNRRKKNN